MLIKLSFGEIGLNRPTDFAIYSAERKLLLQKGHVITSKDLLERLYRVGHREGAAVGMRTGAWTTVKPRPASTDEQNPLLFGIAHLTDIQAARHSPPPSSSAPFPNLGQKVEFFYLTAAEGKEPLRLELSGVISDAALIVRRVAGQDARALEAGVMYEARLFTGLRLFTFTTELLSESAGPFGCLFLKYPKNVAQASVRKHQRVATWLGGKLSLAEYARPVVDVVVENVSSTGACVSAKQDLLIVGQSARLSMHLRVDGRTRFVTVFVEVRNRRPNGERFRYGLEFVRMPEEVRRNIKDFVLDSMALT